MIPEAAIAMLGCARIGAVHSVVFGGFAANELATRINDAKPKIIISASCGIEVKKKIPYKPLLDKAIELSESKYGVVFTPNLSGMTLGAHGFHVHTNPSCDSTQKDGKTVLGGGAGGHYDPKGTGKHGYPWTEDNHLGDLPALYVGMDNKAVQPVVAPRIKLSDLKGRALMIHAGGDNHSDMPSALGGGGARVVCGFID